MFAQSKGGNYGLTDGASGVADAIDFDGATDYLSRSSDLVGNADGKTFTFSAWVWNSQNALSYILASEDSGGATQGFVVWVANTNYIRAQGFDTSGATNLSVDIPSQTFPKETWLHYLISVDLTNSSNRAVYVNDTAVTATWNTYTNSNINYTNNRWAIAAQLAGSAKFKSRLAHVYLDYTYRDLSVEANRRLFITADRKPAANQSALNPILYLPLNDPTQPGKNLGTGGGFALNGVVARSGRGPSQFNAPYSDLDGSADYLSRTTAPVGIADGKQVTFGFTFNSDTFTDYQTIFSVSSGTTQTFTVQIANNKKLLISDGTTSILYVEAGTTFTVGRNYTVVLSFDLSDINKRHITINGLTDTPTWVAFVDTNLDLAVSSTPRYLIGVNGSTLAFHNGRLGNVFFDTRYIDLSQPANLAKFVTGTGIDAKPADLGANGEKPFGTAPLIYLPMYGNNAGKNYGAGGDFTVNSGPFPGARGPNEYWGNKAVFNGSTGKLNRGASLTGISDSKTFSFAFNLNKTASVLYTLLDTTGATLRITVNASNQLVLLAKNSVGSTILSATVTTAIANATNTEVLVCIDLANSANRFVYLNDVAASVTWTTYANDFVDLTVVDACIGSEVAGANYLSGSLAECYFSTSYIDFSQEANRLKFRDAFGNPVDLAPQIAAGTLPNPAIYMRFDPANFGKNSGTGGDFTVSGTITDGGQL